MGHRFVRPAVSLLSLSLAVNAPVLAQREPAARITIISDAFSRDSTLDLDWGFAALIEYGGKRILFDTGNDSAKFAANTEALGINLSGLDFVVISHRHGDHTDGLHHLLSINPDVPIYAPNDEYFGGPTPTVFFSRPVTSLPEHMRYFRGAVPGIVPHGTPWRNARFERVDRTREIVPGVRLVVNRSKTAAFSETPEVSLVLETADGPIVIVGCSHPGIEQILESVTTKHTGARLIVGGLHLVTTSADEIQRLGNSLRNDWKVRGIAPGHCTGEVAFEALMDIYGAEYTYAGAGTVITLHGDALAGAATPMMNSDVPGFFTSPR